MSHAYGAVTVRLLPDECIDPGILRYQVLPDASNAGPGAHPGIVCDDVTLAETIEFFLTGEYPFGTIEAEVTEDPDEADPEA